MKLFGWKPREDSRPALSRGGSGPAVGEWPRSYEAQVREAYLGNAIAQRAVKLVVAGIGSAPLVASDPALIALATRRSGGQTLVETVAAQLLLHGTWRMGWIVSAWWRLACAAVDIGATCRAAMRCAAAIRGGWRRRWMRGWRDVTAAARATCC
jgi:hypothetical protein